jgi:hypothetical protein
MKEKTASALVLKRFFYNDTEVCKPYYGDWSETGVRRIYLAPCTRETSGHSGA